MQMAGKKETHEELASRITDTALFVLQTRQLTGRQQQTLVSFLHDTVDHAIARKKCVRHDQPLVGSQSISHTQQGPGGMRRVPEKHVGEGCLCGEVTEVVALNGRPGHDGHDARQ